MEKAHTLFIMNTLKAHTIHKMVSIQWRSVSTAASATSHPWSGIWIR